MLIKCLYKLDNNQLHSGYSFSLVLLYIVFKSKDFCKFIYRCGICRYKNANIKNNNAEIAIMKYPLKKIINYNSSEIGPYICTLLQCNLE